MREPILRPMQPEDQAAVAALIHRSTNTWYEARGLPSVFSCSPNDVALFCRVYESLDPGCCILAEVDGRLAGSCFWHPRETHVALGIMNAAPEAFGRGVARRLLSYVIERAEERGLPIRLVSSAQNLDSFSLYNRAGFSVYAVHQDMSIEVPDDGLTVPTAVQERASAAVRPATAADIPAMVELEREISGIERRRDYELLVQNAEGIWHVSVAKDDAGRLSGFLASVRHPASEMLGPGVARDEAAALSLILAELDQHRGGAPVFLPPSDRPALLASLYALSARNLELHVAQVRGAAQRPAGVVLPCFLPETG